MEIKKITTRAFAVSADREKQMERRLRRWGAFLGFIPRGSSEIRKAYLPVLAYRLSRNEEVHKGIGRQTVYEKKSNRFHVNLSNGLLYYQKAGTIRSYDLLKRLLDVSPAAVQTLGMLMRRGETLKEEYEQRNIVELMNTGLIRTYKPTLRELLTEIIDEIIADSDDKRHIKHTVVKERVDLNFHIPRFIDPGYDLSAGLKIEDTVVESYERETIKHSVDQIAGLLRDLYGAEVSIDGLYFLPYMNCRSKEGDKKERISKTMYPVCRAGQRCRVKEGVSIKPIALSTEVGAQKTVPVETETIDFSDVSGMDEVKKEIRESIIYPITKPELSKGYDRHAGGGILFYGPPGCGKTYIAKATIGECGLPFFNINLSDLVKKGFEDAAKDLHDIFDEARKNTPSVIFFDELDAVGGKRDVKQAHSEKMLLNQLLTEMDGVESMKENILLIAATNAPWALDPALRRAERFTKQVFVPPPDNKARTQLFRQYTKKQPLVGNIDFQKLSELTEGYSSADIKAVCSEAGRIPWEEAIETGTQRSMTMQDFLRAIRKQGSSLTPWYKVAYKGLEESGEAGLFKDYTTYVLKYAGGVDFISKPGLKFKDLCDLEEAKEEIRKSVVYPVAREDLAEEFGQKLRGGILLYGPPGCGKTHLARATAGECNATFFNIGLTDILSPKKGESERKLRDIFERASRNTPAIVFFDEVDAIVGRRDQLGMDEARLVDEFLTEIDGFKKTKGLIVMAATNAPWAIDPALRRSERFTKQIFIGAPDKKARLELFKMHSKKKPLSQDIGFEKLAEATEGYSSADIKTICDEAAESPWEEALKGAPERTITNEDYEKALGKVKSSLPTWVSMAKKELERSGEVEFYERLYDFLSEYKTPTQVDYREAIREEKLSLVPDEEIKMLESEKTEVSNKIKLAQHKYYTREISEETFKHIIEEYEKQIIEIDLRINKRKKAAGW